MNNHNVPAKHKMLAMNFHGFSTKPVTLIHIWVFSRNEFPRFFSTKPVTLIHSTVFTLLHCSKAALEEISKLYLWIAALQRESPDLQS